MPNYFNPASMLTQGGIDPKSPFAGALAGIQGAYAMKAGDQAQRANEMEFMANLEKYQQALLDRDALASNREASIAKNKYEAEDYSSGRKLERESVNTDYIRSQRDLNKTSINSKERENQGNFLVELAQEIQTNDFQPMKDEERWNQYRERGKKLGLNLPTWLEDRDKMFIVNKANAFVNDAATQRHAITNEGDAQRKLQYDTLPQLAGQFAGREHLLDKEISANKEIAAMKTSSAEDIAKTRAGAGNQRLENLVTEVMNNPQKYVNNPAVIDAVVEYQWQKKLASDDFLPLKVRRDPTIEQTYKEGLKKVIFEAAAGKGTSTSAPSPKPTSQSGNSYDAKTRAAIAAQAKAWGKTEEETITLLKEQKLL
jgi:hypothetical protein